MAMRLIRFAVIGATAVAMVTACGPHTTDQDAALTAFTWYAWEVNGSDVAPPTVTVTFERDGTVTGHTSCVPFTGTYIDNDGQLKLTLADVPTCTSEDSNARHETAVAILRADSLSWDTTWQTLTLSAGPSQSMVLNPSPPPPTSQGATTSTAT
jgi:heat shock protein HslJ